MYIFRFFLKSILVFILFSCSQNSVVYSKEDSKIAKNTIHDSIKNLIENKNLPIVCGAERIEEIQKAIGNKKVGVVANQTSRVGTTHLVDTLLSLQINIQSVFSPEHGFRGKADAGELVKSDKDEKTGLPIVSLYGDNKKPKAGQLQGIEVILFDLQDVGTRFYTYISTLHYVMEACAENNIEVIVLDRPNPNGSYVDGPVRKKGFESFISLDPIPVVHGMTVGELAQMMNGEKWLKNEVICDLKVISCLHYDRTKPYSLPVAPSPNLRSDEAIKLYPSLCFFEGTILSLGRGTETPFEVFGHPDLKGIEGYDFSFTPVSSYGSKSPKLEGKKCYGMNLQEYAKENSFEKLELDWLITAYHHLKRPDFFDSKFFNLLAGTDELQKQIKDGKTMEEIRDSWKEELEDFKNKREKYLLYE